MICKIADLITEIPEAGDLFSRSQDYLCKEKNESDLIIRQEDFDQTKWLNLSENSRIYMQSASLFYRQLLKHNGAMLHASAVELENRAYLFSAPCGTGKSTHTKLWQSLFGDSAKVFNDDKPALRFVDGKWYAYGTPWCGKDGINLNMKVPLAGICFLKQAEENKIRRLNISEAVQKLIWQTVNRFEEIESLNLMLGHVDNLVRRIPVFELENRPEPEAALLSYETMRRAAEEMGL